MGGENHLARRVRVERVDEIGELAVTVWCVAREPVLEQGSNQQRTPVGLLEKSWDKSTHGLDVPTELLEDVGDGVLNKSARS